MSRPVPTPSALVKSLREALSLVKQMLEHFDEASAALYVGFLRGDRAPTPAQLTEWFQKKPSKLNDPSALPAGMSYEDYLRFTDEAKVNIAAFIVAMKRLIVCIQAPAEECKSNDANGLRLFSDILRSGDPKWKVYGLYSIAESIIKLYNRNTFQEYGMYRAVPTAEPVALRLRDVASLPPPPPPPEPVVSRLRTLAAPSSPMAPPPEPVASRLRTRAAPPAPVPPTPKRMPGRMKRSALRLDDDDDDDDDDEDEYVPRALKKHKKTRTVVPRASRSYRAYDASDPTGIQNVFASMTADTHDEIADYGLNDKDRAVLQNLVAMKIRALKLNKRTDDNDDDDERA